MGLTHNKESSTNNNYAYGHGHLIEKGSASTGYRTILAYTASGHRERVNYYSNPGQTYPPTGTSLGEEGVANNVLVLMENRLAMQAVGDESGTCSDGSPPGGNNPTTSAVEGDSVCREILYMILPPIPIECAEKDTI